MMTKQEMIEQGSISTDVVLNVKNTKAAKSCFSLAAKDMKYDPHRIAYLLLSFLNSEVLISENKFTSCSSA